MRRFQPRGDRRFGKRDGRQLHVLYEDDAVVVLNKRAKLLAVPADDSDTPSALSILSAELKSKRQGPLSYIALIVTRLGFCSSQKPGQIEKHSCNSLFDTPRYGNISRQFVVISA
jgi:23S rRNA-/tRNA-specific pseudouridylate synthase